jgi:hypothetical protein
LAGGTPFDVNPTSSDWYGELSGALNPGLPAQGELLSLMNIKVHQ